MNASAIEELIHQTPFEPFESILSSGDQYPVHHDPKGPRNFPNSYVTVSYLHVAAADPMPPVKKKRRTA